MRVNTGEQLLEVALPLLRSLVRRTQSLLVANFGLWHHDEAEYRKLLLQLAAQVF